MGSKTKSSNKQFFLRKQSDVISSSGNGEGAAIGTLSRSSGGGGAMAASTLQPHLGTCRSKIEGMLINVHSPGNRSPPLNKQRSSNSSTLDQFPFPQHPNNRDLCLKSKKHFVSTYSSFRARDNSSSD